MKYIFKDFEKIFIKKIFQNPETGKDDVDTGGEKPQDSQTVDQLVTENDSVRKDAVDNASELGKKMAQEISDKQVAQILDLKDQQLKDPKLQEIIEGVKEELVNVAIETGENVTELFNWRSKKVEKSKVLADVNISSFRDLLRNPNIDLNKLHSDLLSIVSKIKGKFNITTIGEIKDIFNNLGYKPDGAFGPIEASSLFGLVNDISVTQEKFANNKLSDSQKLNILVDFNSDGLLENKFTFNGNEKEFSDLKQGHLNNILNNLGLGVNEFNSSLQKNYFIAREDFKTAIARFSEMSGTSLKQLTLPKDLFDKSMEHLVDMNTAEAQKEAGKEVTEGLNEAELTKQLSDKFDADMKKVGKEVTSDVKQQTLSLVLGDVKGLAYTTNKAGKKMSEITNGILDNVTFGYSPDGKIGLVIGGSKSFAKDRVTLSYGASNFVPYIGIDGKIYKHEDRTTQFFSENMKTGFDVNIGAGASALGTQLNIGANKVNEETSEGIRTMVENMSGLLDNILKNISEGKSFDKSGLPNDPGNKKSYEDLKKLYDSTVGKNVSLLPNFKQGVLKAFQNHLYLNRNEKGFGLTGASLSVIGPILIGGVTFEKLKIDYSKKDTSKMDKFIDELVAAENTKIEAQNLIARTEKLPDREELESKSLEGYNKESLKNVEKMSSQIGNLLQIEDIASMEKGDKFKLGVLEHSIHKLLNNGGNIGEVWKQFEKSMGLLKKDISFLNNLPDGEKLLVLQQIGINFMKKEGLQIGPDGSVVLKGNHKGKNINSPQSYDEAHNRKDYFDKIFKKEFPGVAASISTAREEYYKQFKNPNYTISQYPEGGIGFTGVQIGPKGERVDSVNPYVTGNIAAFDGVPGKIEIKTNQEGLKELANKLPNHLLQPMIDQLKASGYEFSGNESEIDQMKKIIVDGKAGNIKVEGKLYFAKAAECLNDTVIMDFKINYTKVIPGEKPEVIPIIPKIELANLSTAVGNADSKKVNIGVSKDITKPKTPPSEKSDGETKTQTGDKVEKVGTNEGHNEAIKVDVNVSGTEQLKSQGVKVDINGPVKTSVDLNGNSVKIESTTGNNIKSRTSSNGQTEFVKSAKKK